MSKNKNSFDGGFLKFAWDNLSFRDRNRILANNLKTAWLFGAGASHHYSLNSRDVPIPLSKDFFSAFNDLSTSEGFQSNVGPLISYLYHNRGIKPTNIHTWTENIEEFMTSIEEKIDYLKTQKNKNGKLNKIEFAKLVEASGVYNNMTFILANVLNEAQNGPSYSAYSELLKFCGPKDIFITFNWDTLLDRALASSGFWSPNTGYNINFTSILDGVWKDTVDISLDFKDNWKLFKLHGSSNWLVPYTGIYYQTLELQSIVKDPSKIFLYWQSFLPYKTYRGRWKGGYETTCYGYYPPNLPTDKFSGESISAEPGKVILSMTPISYRTPFKEPSIEGIPSSPLLITPVKQKRYDDYVDTIEQLWKKAKKSLAKCSRIVVIGYSFPETDLHSLNMIRDVINGHPNEIELMIIDPFPDDIAERIGNEHISKAKRLLTLSLKFEEYIMHLWENTPDLMKKAAKDFKEVSDWLELIKGLKESWPLF